LDYNAIKEARRSGEIYLTTLLISVLFLASLGISSSQAEDFNGSICPDVNLVFRSQKLSVRYSRGLSGISEDWSSYSEVWEAGERMLAKAHILLDSQKPVRICLLSQSELLELTPRSAVVLHAWTPKTQNEVFLDVSWFGSEQFLHSFGHELFHVLVPSFNLRWAEEGLAELLAGILDGKVPLNAIRHFQGSIKPRSMLKDDLTEFNLQDYGHNYMFMRFVYDTYANRDFLGTLRFVRELLVDKDKFSKAYIEFVKDYVKTSSFNYHNWTETLPEMSFAVLDVTHLFDSGIPFELKADPEKTKSFLVLRKPEADSEILELTQNMTFPPGHFASVQFLIVNPSFHEASYRIFVDPNSSWVPMSTSDLIDSPLGQFE
jgi:hypothetical protein